VLDFSDFSKWLKACHQIESATRRAYHLTGTRPGELARLRWANVKHNERNLVIGKAKAGLDIVIPVSDEIAAALQMARDDAAQLGLEVAPDGLIPRLLTDRPQERAACPGQHVPPYLSHGCGQSGR
jgi:integrase